MKTIQLESPGHFRSLDVDPPEAPGTGEALVRVHRLGICGTDLHAFAGKQPFFEYPRILGHELAVEVVELGPEAPSGLAPGDLCSVEPYLNCGECIACRHGKSNCCVNMQVLGVHVDGGMREFFLLPANKLHPSKFLTPDQLALVETLAIGCHAVDRAGIQPGETVLICGAGPIGLATIPFAMEQKARVIVADINPNRLDFCRSHLGVELAFSPLDPKWPECLSEVAGGHLPTAVFDATGNPASMMAAFNYPAHGGRLVLIGLFQGELTFHDPTFHKKELTLLASRNALSKDFPKIIQLLESGRIDIRPWITHQCAFENLICEFPTWTQPENRVVKAMVSFP